MVMISVTTYQFLQCMTVTKQTWKETNFQKGQNRRNNRGI